MTPWQRAVAGLLLGTALLGGLGIYILTRAATLPDGYPLSDLDGQTRELAEFRGQPLVVNFWATWCPPCRREIPLLVDLQANYPELTVVGIAVEEADPVIQFVAETELNYPILIGEQTAIELAEALGIEFIGLPYSVLIDATGRVLEIHTGEFKPEDVAPAVAKLFPDR